MIGIFTSTCFLCKKFFVYGLTVTNNEYLNMRYHLRKQQLALNCVKKDMSMTSRTSLQNFLKLIKLIF